MQTPSIVTNTRDTIIIIIIIIIIFLGNALLKYRFYVS
jgi:hypothetical protein